MKTDLRWQVLVAVAGFGLVLALLSYQIQTVGLCTVREPAAGGVFAEGVVGAPQYINPLFADENPVDRELVGLVFDGLTRIENGQLTPALAERWEISEDGRFVRFFLREDVTWHDGQPFTAADVAFTYGLMQDENFPGDSALKRLWETVTIRTLGEYEIEFELQEPFSGFLNATTRGILPAHILAAETADSILNSAFNRQPVGTGPFMIDPGQDWQQTRSLLLTPDPAHWREGIRINNIGFRFYPDESAVLEAFEKGEIQAINNVSPAMLPEVSEMEGIRLFSTVAPRYSSLLFNLTDSGSPATQSLDVRRSLTYGLNRGLLVDETLNGQGVPLDGPYLPNSWAYNAEALKIIDSQPISATLGLEDSGWLFTAENQPREKDGEPLSLRLLVYNTPTNRALAQSIEQQWQEIGVQPLIEIFSDWSEYRKDLSGRNFDVALIDVGPLSDPDLYDFWSQEAIIHGQNYAGWNNRRASEALEEGRKIWPIEERKPYYDTFLRQFGDALPELTLFQHVYTYAVRDDIPGIEIGRIESPRDRYRSLSSWILLYRDVTVACAEEPD